MCRSSLQIPDQPPTPQPGRAPSRRSGIFCLSGSAPRACPPLGPPATATAVPVPAAGSTAKELRGLYLGLEGAAIGPICCSSAAGTPAEGAGRRDATPRDKMSQFLGNKRLISPR